MPPIDLPTLFLLSTALFATMAAMFVVTWAQDRQANAAMLWWALGHGAGVPACVLLALRGEIPAWLSIGAANVAVLTGFGLFLAGVLVFEGRKPDPVVIFGGAAVWIAASLTSLVWDHFPVRVVLMSVLISGHAAASALLIWRGGRIEPLPTRRFAAGVLGLVALTHLARLLLTLHAPVSESFAALGRGWTAFIALQILLQTVLLGYAIMALVKERAEYRQRQAAEVDSLTGLHTRRAFLDRAARRLAADPSRGALLVFDLDRFKAINDTHGHLAGDRVLCAFATTVAEHLDAEDVAGRLGGEEFAVFLANADFSAAWRLADEIRRDFAAFDVRHEDRPIAATVSVGVAAVPLIEADLGRLLASADAGLYAAKKTGRDCVRAAEDAPPRKGVGLRSGRSRRLP